MQRRRSERIPLNLPTKIFLGGKSYDGIIVNVSEDGSGSSITSVVDSQEEFIPAYNIQLYFHDPSGRAIELVCELTWFSLSETDPGKLAIGMKILNPPLMYKVFINKLCDVNLKDKSKEQLITELLEARRKIAVLESKAAELRQEGGEELKCQDAQHLKMNGCVVWITGLPGSGKSTIAEAVKERCQAFFILRMDELRKIVTPEPTYTDEEREMVYRSIVYTAGVLSELGHDVLIDATGNLRRWRELARKTLPLFMEVYVRCSLETCRQREEQRAETHGAPKGIYQKGIAGWPVPGVNVPYEEPLNAEVVIDSDNTTIEKAAEEISSFIKKLKQI